MTASDGCACMLKLSELLYAGSTEWLSQRDQNIQYEVVLLYEGELLYEVSVLLWDDGMLLKFLRLHNLG